MAHNQLLDRFAFLLALLSLPLQAIPSNPALSVLSPTQFEFGTRVIGANFDGIEAPPTSSTTLWSLGYTHAFSLERIWDRKAGISIALTGPYGTLRSLRAYQTSDYYPLRYGHTDSQFQAKAGLGIELIPNRFFLGAGIQFYLSGAGNSEATLSATHPTGRLALDVGLNSALYFGTFYQNEKVSLSLVYREEMNPEFIQKFDARASIGHQNTFHQPLTAKSHLYFEPRSIELEGKYGGDPVGLGFGVNYQVWSRYHAPVLIAETVDAQGNFSSTPPPDTEMKNTWNPFIHFEVAITEGLRIGAKYLFCPTAIVDLSGIGNPLDTNTHAISLGLSGTLNESSVIPFSFDWNLLVEHHIFEARTVVKRTGSQLYTFGGSAYIYSATISIPL